MIDSPQPNTNIAEDELTEPHLVQKEIRNYQSNVASDYPGFERARGLKPEKTPEFKLGDLAASVYDTSTYGLAHQITADALRSDVAVPGYDSLEYIDDQFLNDNDVWYFVNDVNPEQTKANNLKLARDKAGAIGAANYPYRYFGAYMAAGLVDPINWAFPGASIANATKEAYILAKAGKAALAARELGHLGLQSAALGSIAAGTQELLIQQTRENRETIDSVYNVMASTALSGIFGAAIPGTISGYHYSKAQSQVANVMAGNTPTPTVAPKSKIFAMDATAKAEMKGDDVVAALPPLTKKMMSISPAGRLRNSKSVSAAMASTDLATTSLVLNKNIGKNIPTQAAVDDHIAKLRGVARKTSIDINKIFMEQQGISSNAFSGIRSRIAEARGNGLNRQAFSEAMFEAMESGKPSGHNSVNMAVTRVKSYLNSIKEELVAYGKLDKKFLEPEFDNYFTHHWLEPVISRNHEDFKLLIFKWYSEVNNWYRAAQPELSPLVEKLTFAETELAKANRNLQRVTNSREYKEFQISKIQTRGKIKQLRNQALEHKKTLLAEIKELKRQIKEVENESLINPVKPEIDDKISRELQAQAKVELIDIWRKKIIKETDEAEAKISEYYSGNAGIALNARDQLKKLKRMIRAEADRAGVHYTSSKYYAEHIKLKEKYEKILSEFKGKLPSPKEIKELRDTIKRYTGKRLNNIPEYRQAVTSRYYELLKEATPKENTKLAQLNANLKQKIDIRKEIEESLGLLKVESKKAKSTKFERQAELEERIARFKALEEERREALYDKIPSKYLTPGGWVPMGDKNPLELAASAQQTFYRTTGSDVSSCINPIIGGGGKNPNPLQARLLTMPYDYSVSGTGGNVIRASDFLSKDIWRMLDNYSNSTTPVLAFDRLARSRGFKDSSELKEWYLKNIEADYDELMQGISGNDALKLNRSKKKDFRNLNDLWDQQLNLAGKSGDLFGIGFARFNRRLRQYTAERMLGSAALSSLTDPFVAPFRQGIFNAIQDWLVPFCGQIAGRNKAFKINKQDINDLGFALETQMGKIAKKIYDNDDLLIEQKWWQSIAEPAVNMFGNITGLSQINDLTQSFAGHISISRTLRNIARKFQTGKISKKNEVRLRQISISPESERHIYDMWKESGGKDRGAYYSNLQDWNLNSDARIQAFQEFTTSISRDIQHSTLRSSKSEQPAFYNSFLGGMVFRFKDYLLAANQKLLLSGLQKLGMREYEVMLASTLLLAQGSLTYVLNGLAKDPTGENIDLSPERLLREGLDRSALLGLFGEPINIFQKQGWLPGQTVSRYQSRGLVGNWMGPEVGVADDFKNALIDPLINKLKDEGGYTTKDALAILRLIPFQNLFYLRYLNEQITRKTAESLGAEPRE